MVHSSLNDLPGRTVGESRVKLVGMDFGTTTSKAAVASAKVLRNCVTGRMELGELEVVYRPEPVFTPLDGDVLDEIRLDELLEQWMAEGGLKSDAVMAGGAIITGLAAQKKNAALIAALVKQRVGQALIATANDPCLESWLAFMGNCAALSATHPDVSFLNLDIGGGTTNLALGRDGEVQSVGCFFIGARHFQFTPGTYRLSAVSRYGCALLEHLEISKRIGEELLPANLCQILDFYVTLLEAAVTGQSAPFENDCARLLQQIPFRFPDNVSKPVVTFSGGVGELVYRGMQGQPWPGTTAFGDIGVEFAARILESPILSKDLRNYVPSSLGRATVYGLALHNTEVSGTTLFLPRPEILPLRDLPIVGRLSSGASAEQIQKAVELVRRTSLGGCLRIELASDTLAEVRRLGQGLSDVLRSTSLPSPMPLVLFVSGNVGKSLGNYASDWGRVPVSLVVIDELPTRRAHFASLGSPANGVVPVSFYGMDQG